ncbi:MAG: hypothetical protein CMP07_06395 [Xanthomonadales bacterium]|nr:hypothetical protein [Xanthomonadales bacterium]|tara:strand:+ start:4602 stop:4832 length:231 start_codon:yes stop_codon:yes gene_type:complete
MQDINQGTQSVGQWMLTLLITFIPLVNIIALLIWAFGSSTHPEKSNWAKAMLIWFAIFIGLSLLMTLLGLGAGSAM